jgi:methionyl-tRNA synthetase
MDALKLGEAAQAALAIVTAVDLHIESTQPFKLAKDPAKLSQVGEVLYRCAEALRIASVLLWPVMPGKCAEVWGRMGLDYAQRLEARAASGGAAGGEACVGAASGGTDSGWASWTAWGGLRPGAPIEKGDALFMRHQPGK